MRAFLGSQSHAGCSSSDRVAPPEDANSNTGWCRKFWRRMYSTGAVRFARTIFLSRTRNCSKKAWARRARTADVARASLAEMLLASSLHSCWTELGLQSRFAVGSTGRKPKRSQTLTVRVAGAY